MERRLITPGIFLLMLLLAISAANSAGPQVRLVDGNTNCSGRVEVFFNNQWGTVCDDRWDRNDAEVVCRQLGCGNAQSAPSNAHFQQGSGQIWMDEVSCSGSETSLTECSHNGFGTHDCGHHEDASVVCSARPQVRLVDGNTNCSGRVEVFFNNQWGTVCDDGWDRNAGRNAEVVCRQLGCGTAQSAPSSGQFQQGSGQIWMDEVSCSGSETSLTECSHNGFGTHDCGHHEDASVVCSERPVFPAPELVCGRSDFQVGIHRAQLEAAGLNASSGHLDDRLCSAHVERNGTVWYQVDRREGSCGTMRQTNHTHMTYSNSLFVYPFPSRDVSYSEPVSFPFSCVFPLDAKASLNMAITMAVQPLLRGGEVGVIGFGARARTSMSLYRNANYTQPFQAGPVSLPVGSRVHVGVSAEATETEQFVVVLEHCYATHSPNPDDFIQYSFIQNRCPSAGSQVRVDENGSSLQARFSALLFMFQGNSQDVFLHCSLSLCDSSCSPRCSGRPSRSVSTSAFQEPLTIGPISWVSGPV